MALSSRRASISSSIEDKELVWRIFAEAKGAVLVPAQTDVVLEITDPAIGFVYLSKLGPGDIQGVVWDRGRIYGNFAADPAPYLRHLSSLKMLGLYRTNIGDAGLETLASLQSLEVLDLGSTMVTDAGLESLKQFPRLRVLDLGETQITDAGLAHVKDLQSLEYLGLAGTRITDAGLAEISRLTSLRVLMLAETAITSAGLAHLKDMQALEYLQIAGTNTTNSALPYLKQLRSLKIVHVTGTGLTDAAAAELKDAIPGVLLLFDWMEGLFTKMFLCCLIAAPLILLFLPLLNRKMRSGAPTRRPFLLVLSIIVGLLIWFAPVILPEIRSFGAGNPFGWYGAYTQALALGILFGTAIYVQAHLANVYSSSKSPIPVLTIFLPLAAYLLVLPFFGFSFPFLVFPLPPGLALVVGGVSYYHAAKRRQT